MTGNQSVKMVEEKISQSKHCIANWGLEKPERSGGTEKRGRNGNQHASGYCNNGGRVDLLTATHHSQCSNSESRGEGETHRSRTGWVQRPSGPPLRARHNDQTSDVCIWRVQETANSAVRQYIALLRPFLSSQIRADWDSAHLNYIPLILRPDFIEKSEGNGIPVHLYLTTPLSPLIILLGLSYAVTSGQHVDTVEQDLIGTVRRDRRSTESGGLTVEKMLNNYSFIALDMI